MNYWIHAPHLNSSDLRAIFTQVAVELLRDETYCWAMYEYLSPTKHLLMVRHPLLPDHKANLERAYNCTLTEEHA